MRKGRPIPTAPTSGQYGPRLLNLPETGTKRICLRPAPKEGSPPPLSVHTAKEGRQETEIQSSLCDPGGAGCRSLFHADAHRRDCISVSCLPSFAVWTASGGGLPSLGAGRRQIRSVPVSDKLTSGKHGPKQERVT